MVHYFFKKRLSGLRKPESAPTHAVYSGDPSKGQAFTQSPKSSNRPKVVTSEFQVYANEEKKTFLEVEIKYFCIDTMVPPWSEFTWVFSELSFLFPCGMARCSFFVKKFKIIITIRIVTYYWTLSKSFAKLWLPLLNLSKLTKEVSRILDMNQKVKIIQALEVAFGFRKCKSNVFVCLSSWKI